MVVSAPVVLLVKGVDVANRREVPCLTGVLGIGMFCGLRDDPSPSGVSGNGTFCAALV
jgi:hypothetical protein